MHREFVTHVFETSRPTDWASVLAIGTDVDGVLEKLPYKFEGQPRWFRLMAKNHNTTPQHATRDVFDWLGPTMAVMIEGWVNKE